ncbi:hypothetical protein CAPN007_04320 [Capnocytophaga canimorsus]|nr:hypothetical protein CAPN007_04320 [Capnocytophaga canimorsus]
MWSADLKPGQVIVFQKNVHRNNLSDVKANEHDSKGLIPLLEKIDNERIKKGVFTEIVAFLCGLLHKYK